MNTNQSGATLTQADHFVKVSCSRCARVWWVERQTAGILLDARGKMTVPGNAVRIEQGPKFVKFYPDPKDDGSQAVQELPQCLCGNQMKRELS